MNIKKISILGSTGSIGHSTLKIVEKKNFLKVSVLSANKNFTNICKQIKKYKPEYFIVSDKKTFKKVKKKFEKKKIKILNNFNLLKNKKKIDITVAAIPGIAGLKPTLSMISFSKKILIANKESIICGWNLIKKKASKFKTKIVPVDSEHFSIFKLLQNENYNEIKKIYITASGGPFLNFKKNQFKKIKPIDAIKHPKWKMGKKISVDSSTMMNKILELIEAQKLFNLSPNQLDIVVHPESLVHAIVELKNGLKKFIYHETSMIIPLANAILDEEFDIRFLYNSKNKDSLKNLTFKKVNYKTFPLLKLKNKATLYPSSPIIINASNEVLVQHFLSKKIPFLGINKIIFNILKNRNFKKNAIRKPFNINQINLVDNWAREETLKQIKKVYE